jgi:hypothetical protein
MLGQTLPHSAGRSGLFAIASRQIDKRVQRERSLIVSLYPMRFEHGRKQRVLDGAVRSNMTFEFAQTSIS